MSYKDWGVSKTFRFADERLKTMLQSLFRGEMTQASIGAAPDYLEVATDGTLTLHGESTVWDDITSSLIGRQLSSTAGKLDYDWEENAIVFNSAGDIAVVNDRLVWSFQYPHAAKTNGEVQLHVHWEQTDTVAREFTLQYRIQNNGAIKNTTWTTVVVDTNANNAFTYTSGTLNQITALKNIDMTGASLSATMQFRLARTDAVAGDIRSTFVDAHVERDTLGSDDPFVK